MKKGLNKIIILLILGCFIIGLTSCTLFSKTDDEQVDTPTEIITNPDAVGKIVNINVSEKDTTITDLETAIAKAYQSVVVINASSVSGTSSGSGVIIGNSDSYTYIATCCHVVDGFNNYQVITNDGKEYKASLIGADPNTDLAVIVIEATGLQIVSFVNNSDELHVGQEAIAIGNPLGTLGGTVTKGIVSSTSRNIKMSDGTVHNLIQTDASINSGNSGGGLFNNQGELIGIVSAKYAATGVEGLGFAIPANQVRNIVTNLIENGYVDGRTVLGVTFADGYYREGSGFFGGTYHDVVYVLEVETNGSAYNILKKDDILVSISVKYNDSTKDSTSLSSIKNATEVNDFIEGLDLTIGDEITFVIKRGGYNVTQSTYVVKMSQYVYK